MSKPLSFWITLALWGVSLVVALFWISRGDGDSRPSSPSLGKRIAVVDISGPIAYEENTTGVIGIRSGGVLSWLDDLETASRDPLTGAVVLRINSPGGTVGATQELHAAIKRLRERGKVVIASCGDIAASGGYYIATACDAIVSLPGTLTGSIGVIMQGFDYHLLMEKLGIKATVIKSGENKDLMAGYREMTPAEKDILFSVVSNTYEQFVAAVAEGRHLSIQEVKSLADGRIFTGEQAMEAKLVDRLGSFEDAVNLARTMAKLPPSAPLYFPADESLNWQRILRRLTMRMPLSLPTSATDIPHAKLLYYTTF